MKAPFLSRSVLVLIISWSACVVPIFFLDNHFLFPSIKTEILIISFLSAIVCGMTIDSFSNIKETDIKPLHLSSFGESVCKGMLVIYFLSVSLVILRMLYYNVYLEIHLTRGQIYSPVKGMDSYLFSMLYVLALYLKGVASTFCYFFSFKEMNLGRKIVPLIFVGLVLFDAFAFSSKGPLVELLFFVGVYCLLFTVFLKKNVFQLSVISLALLLAILWIVVARGGVDADYSSLMFYFSTGPVLLSSLVDVGDGLAGSDWSNQGGILVFSGLDYFISLFFRALGAPIETIGFDWIRYISETSVVGQGYPGGFALSTAFYTILAEPYVSFGFFGVLLFGYLIGNLLSKLERNVLVIHCDHSLFWFLYFYKIIIFGVFGSPFNSVVFWLVLGFSLLAARALFHAKRGA